MLIRDAAIWGGPRGDVRIAGTQIAAIGALDPLPGEEVIEARGGLLLPGLHDHHLHLAGAAARHSSLLCGPPAVRSAPDLAAALSQPGVGWLRGIDYHESVAGMLTAAQLDAMAPQRPVRIQHRSGRMWFLNSAGLDLLLAGTAPPPGLDRATGQLFDSDLWLRARLQSAPPDLTDLGESLAGFGVTGVTEMSPGNGPAEATWIAGQRRSGALPQTCLVAGSEALGTAALEAGLTLGPLKLHFHENAMPDFGLTVQRIAAAHEAGRAIAVHCTTEVELVFTLAAIEEAGAMAGDRVEHAGIADDHLVERIAALGLAVVCQPHFIAERGDSYLAGVPAAEHSWLYRLAAFRRAGVTLAAGSDAPHGGLDPWAGMQAAVDRRTAAGQILGRDEGLTPEDAVRLYLKHPASLAEERRIAAGAPADLCLLAQPWQALRGDLRAACVGATICAGRLIHDGINQAPFERQPSADAAP